jgi:hypothetical protein
MACVLNHFSNTEIVGCLVIAETPLVMPDTSNEIVRWTVHKMCAVLWSLSAALLGRWCLVRRRRSYPSYQMNWVPDDRRSPNLICYLVEAPAPHGVVNKIAKIIKRTVLSMLVVLSNSMVA